MKKEEATHAAAMFESTEPLGEERDSTSFRLPDGAPVRPVVVVIIIVVVAVVLVMRQALPPFDTPQQRCNGPVTCGDVPGDRFASSARPAKRRAGCGSYPIVDSDHASPLGLESARCRSYGNVYAGPANHLDAVNPRIEHRYRSPIAQEFRFWGTYEAPQPCLFAEPHHIRVLLQARVPCPLSLPWLAAHSPGSSSRTAVCRALRTHTQV